MDTNLKGYWLGHSAFKFISQSGSIIYVDPFLKDNPSTPEEYKEITEADFILLTHGHEDHVGDTLEIAKNTGCKVVGIVELIGLLQKKGLSEEQAVPFNKGGTVRFDDFSVTMVSANHSSSFDGEYAGDPAGLVLSFEDDLCIYHMGDTNIFSDLALYGELYEPHVVLAPIGDHFTMGPQEAAYAVAFEEMTKIPITQLVTVIAVTQDEPQLFIERRDDHIAMFQQWRGIYKEKYGV